MSLGLAHVAGHDLRELFVVVGTVKKQKNELKLGYHSK